MGRAVGGAGAAGCGAFTLVGLLVGVGLTVWLGSMALSGTMSGPKRTTTTAAPTLPAAAAITAAVPPALDDGGAIDVSGTGFRPGPVELALCLTHPAAGAPDPCDPATATAVTVGPEGTLAVAFTAPRVITVAGTRYDCAAAPGACSIRARLAGSSAGPSAAVSFATGLAPTDAVAPPTG